ncbi:hypothetical protein UFOVP1196_71 [uncultured Caudovirales phage]|uniref:Uncharacterized protein n=1 Tax=uncultured Caudovirales phage TaxID=2100421 RepID=A0A6J5RFV6_9CAUD|nr:hypothetical protein UFOVP1196_71 [uncultured Caudovirales phage]
MGERGLGLRSRHRWDCQVKFTGVEQLKQKLARLAKKIPLETASALYMEAQVEMTEAKRRTPREFGPLRASGFVTLPTISGRNISVTLAFGGVAAGYAVYVHEIVGLNHPIGQDHFLSSTLNESVPYMAKRIARRIELNRMI